MLTDVAVDVERALELHANDANATRATQAMIKLRGFRKRSEIFISKLL